MNLPPAIRFLLVGGVATLVHMLVAAGILLVRPDVSAFVANAGAFACAFLVSFVGHRHFTFARPGSLWRFLVVALGGFALNNAILAVALALSVPKLVAVVVATACVPVLTYLASSLWAFRIKH